MHNKYKTVNISRIQTNMQNLVDFLYDVDALMLMGEHCKIEYRPNMHCSCDMTWESL